MSSKATQPAPIGSVRPVHFSYERAPQILFWELTLACKLVCRHCRARAMRRAMPGELSTSQIVQVLDDICEFGTPLPHLVLTGGDPFERNDLGEIMREAHQRGIGVSLAPSVTPLLTFDRLREAREAGMSSISLSLDGSCPERHDYIRRVPGIFDQTMEVFSWCEELNIPVQVNSLVSADTIDDIMNIYQLLKTKKIMRWTPFFLIQTGRGVRLSEIEPSESEELLTQLWKVRESAPFSISTTEALHYRRIAYQSLRTRGLRHEDIINSPLARAWGVRDGNGIGFISFKGQFTPSGFLPEVLGNVTTESIVDMYRNHPLMQSLRNPNSFQGKCGICEYNQICGGSRARAYAATRNALAEDPMCTYVPQKLRHSENRIAANVG